ncbi:hypothetical protein B0T26DRAFT_781622 [Lasiosphaeria miniovina]|uniref:Uncharacterized protein n=1 Tax=Lasiosphaeria miniovina TaxID=1954250 RepID=A0AA40ACA0_9PEZI|nr:uncharacterized protein B0T26DRAFT_781622 [Lasiosphaeria miniovina]KAK0713213.1 hypothetical protein B0T26DRAFT_781622 [Lasiosphaeria miniovina]
MAAFPEAQHGFHRADPVRTARRSLRAAPPPASLVHGDAALSSDLPNPPQPDQTIRLNTPPRLGGRGHPQHPAADAGVGGARAADQQLDAAAGTAGGWTAALVERLMPAAEYSLAYYRQVAGWDAVFAAAYHRSIAAVVHEFEHLVAHAEKYPLDIAVWAAVLELTALGSFAASWMAQHSGHVPRRAFVSFLKRLDMDWSQV